MSHQDAVTSLVKSPLSAQGFLIVPGPQTRTATWTLMTLP
jgi:hypothetical protein